MKEEQFVMVITTTSSEEKANELAMFLVSGRSGACVHVKEIESFYVWQDELVSSREFEVSIKTTYKQFKKNKNAIAQLSEQELPQIIVVPIIKGEKEYMQWIKNSIK